MNHPAGNKLLAIWYSNNECNMIIWEAYFASAIDLCGFRLCYKDPKQGPRVVEWTKENGFSRKKDESEDVNLKNKPSKSTKKVSEKEMVYRLLRSHFVHSEIIAIIIQKLAQNTP